MVTPDSPDLLVPEVVKVEKMYLSKDDHEVVESSSSAVSIENSSSRNFDEFGLKKKETVDENKLAKIARYTSIIDFL